MIKYTNTHTYTHIPLALILFYQFPHRACLQYFHHVSIKTSPTPQYFAYFSLPAMDSIFIDMVLHYI